MRPDLDQSLHRSHIDPAKLSTFERILLTTDGTVTDMLEAYFFEQIQLVKLSEELITLESDLPAMDLSPGSEVVQRKILLQGKISRRNYIYAESILALDRLEDPFRKELLDTKTPIGKIWLEQKVETFKEIIDTGKQPANGLSNYFNIAEDEPVLFRTYCVRSNRKPTMMITEKFPKIYFNKEI
jgi:chorismate-pyruvate lyase